MSLLDCDGAQIFFDYGSGDGPVVILVNGHTRSSTDFRQMFKYLQAQGYRVLIFDNRCSGQSECPARLVFSDFVNDLRHLMNGLWIDRAHLLGISMGGMICHAFTQEFPDRVDSICLVSTAPSAAFVNPESNEIWPSHLKGIEERLSLYFAPDFYQKNKVLVSLMAKEILKNSDKGVFAERARKQKQAMSEFNLVGMTSDCPCLIIHGESDRIVPPHAARSIREIYVKSKEIIYPSVGHLILAENPKGFYADYVEFLQSIGGNQACT